jgi:hypothetical protein
MNHFNTAWVALGSTIRMGQIIGFQKQHLNTDYIDMFEEMNRRSCFWAIFMLDRYLSTALGRPMMLNECDITIPMPEQSSTDMNGLEPQEVKLMAGMVAHTKWVTTKHGIRHIHDCFADWPLTGLSEFLDTS